MPSFVTIESYDKVYQAQVAKLALEQEGIECFLENETIISMDWFLSNAVGGVKLQVASEDSDTAFRILQSIKDSQIENETALSGIKIVCLCNSCKKLVSFDGKQGGRVENCPRCGRYLDVPLRTDDSLTPEAIRNCIDQDTGADSTSMLSNRRYLAFEVFAVLCFAYFLDLKNGIQFYFGLLETQEDIPIALDYQARFLWVRSCVVLVLMVPILMAFGLPRLNQLPRSGSWLRLSLEGSGLTGAMLLVATAIHYVAPGGFESHTYWPNVADDQLVFSYILAIIANSFAEELVMRAYLIDRLYRLLGSKYLAVGISALMFGSYHLYQGFWPGFVGASLTGIILGYYFLGTRRILPLVFAHTAYNLIVEFAVPFFE